EIAAFASRPVDRRERPLSGEDTRFLRCIARRTWLYFETFAGPADNWLPPDNVQEDPHTVVARRTSPTNIGMLFLAALTAWRLGQLGRAELLERVGNAMDSLERLPRYRGHVLNWVRTTDLTPLEPRYVSTVDSGNLAASLIVLARALDDVKAGADAADAPWAGLEDLLSLVADTLGSNDMGADLANAAAPHLDAMRAAVAAVRAGTRDTEPVLADLANTLLPALDDALAEAVAAAPAISTAELRELQVWLDRTRHHVAGMQRDLAAVADPGATARQRATASALAARARAFAMAMDFAMLFDPRSRLLHIGYDVTSGRMDPNCYDLLATEARIASFFAIAKGDLPVRHWFRLGREVARARGRLSLVSWSGSMFEYLMPEILMPAPRDTLLGESAVAAVDVQIDWGNRLGIPWGVSESGFAEQDPEGNYRYRAFGVPGLGLKRGLDRDRVVAPYASMLALLARPTAAIANLRRLAGLGMVGRHGFHEAIDYTPERLPPRGDFRIVRSWMAHHQGMGLAAIGNLLVPGLHARWFLSDPAMAAADLLLSERVPWEATPETMRAAAVTPANLARPEVPGLYPWASDGPGDHRATHLVATSQLSAMLTTGGGGSLSSSGNLVLRGLGSATGEAGGRFLLLHEPETGTVWDMAAPTPPDRNGGDTTRAVFHPHMLELHRRAHGIMASSFEGAGADEPILVRRVTLVNETGQPRRLVVASVAEVVLGRAEEHDRHPSFSRMFVESAWLPGLASLFFRRRPRHAAQSAPVLLHRLVSEDPRVRLFGFETDRRRFLGRHGRVDSPLRLSDQPGGPGMTGFTLDPMVALMAEVRLPPHSRAELHFLSVVAPGEAAAKAIAQRHLTPESIEWELGAAGAGMAHEAHRRGIRPDDLPLLQRLLSQTLRPSLDVLDTVPGSIAQPDLWALGISGDDPLILVLSSEGQRTALLQTLLAGHRWWRERGIPADLVVLHGGESGYVEPVRDRLMAVLRDAGAQELLGRRSGIHIVADGGPGAPQANALRAAARLVLDADGPPLAEQLSAPRRPRINSPPFAVAAELEDVPLPELPLPPIEEAHSDGGFAADGRSYVVDLRAGLPPPAPRANVIANPEFGTIVTEAGLGWTWALNAGENRLTPWTNDPVADPQSEALYLRDELTARVWTPTPLPCGSLAHTVVEHAAGCTRFSHVSHGLVQEVTVFVARDLPVKLVRLRVDNAGNQMRRLTATYFVDWLLGSVRGLSDPLLAAWYAPERQAILARNGRNPDFAGATAFLAATLPPHSITTSKDAFVGPEGDIARPEGLARWDLGQRMASRGDCCGAFQVHLDVPAGGRSEVVFLLGQGASEAEVGALLARFRHEGAVAAELASIEAGWRALTAAVEVETPDPRLDRMVNHWLVVQAVSSRINARAGFYQAGGAIGFRDQLQDVMHLLFTDPGRARAHILEAARHQFEEGDVLHWWHPPGGQGVRTRCSDDLLWLPFVTSAYVEATGDVSILEEHARFLTAPPLAEGEHDRYARYAETARSAPLFEHLERAMERGHTLGANGLPLIGTGDWNDGMDRIGAAGRGQSLWLGWFLASAIEGFARLCRQVDREALALRWEARRRALLQAIERVGWDGDWYIRAIDDEGVPWGSAVNEECRIDLISQAWAVLSGGADPARARRAMDSAFAHLVRPDDHIVRLLDPPFHATPRDPGYIRAYPPGIRENGGQYSHAAAWAGLAFARLGDGARAKLVFDRLNPACHAATADSAARFMTEPYVMAADIGGTPPHVGRGGWSWYTGAAGWTWRLAVEGILGLSLKAGKLAIAPCLPPDWPGYRAIVRQPGGSLEVRVTVRPEARTDAPRVQIGGADWEGPVAFPTDGSTLTVDVTVGLRQEPVPAG
ncbi:MAG: GH36-type glycosyl hydrolase domain-containing protein, partial [Thermaurantiacus sp.]